MRHRLVLCSKTFIYVTTHYRIHKETTCIAHYLRVGQLCLANLYYCLTQKLRRRHSLNTLCSKSLTYIAIVEVGRIMT